MDIAAPYRVHLDVLRVVDAHEFLVDVGTFGAHTGQPWYELAGLVGHLSKQLSNATTLTGCVVDPNVVILAIDGFLHEWFAHGLISHTNGIFIHEFHLMRSLLITIQQLGQFLAGGHWQLMGDIQRYHRSTISTDHDPTCRGDPVALEQGQHQPAIKQNLLHNQIIHAEWATQAHIIDTLLQWESLGVVVEGGGDSSSSRSSSSSSNGSSAGAM